MDGMEWRGEWLHVKVGDTEMRGRTAPTGVKFEQVSPSYDQSDLNTAVGIITEHLKDDRPGYYWEVTNMVTGKVIQHDARYPTTDNAVRAAKVLMYHQFYHFKGDHLVIKIFDKCPDERLGVTYTPIHTESYWVGGSEEIKMSGEMTEVPLGRPFPQTYSDWASLGDDIRAKEPTWSTSVEVNNALNAILEEERGEAEPDAGYTADDAKRWLTEKARELGVDESHITGIWRPSQ